MLYGGQTRTFSKDSNSKDRAVNKKILKSILKYQLHFHHPSGCSTLRIVSKTSRIRYILNSS
jgi:hypothetical protein